MKNKRRRLREMRSNSPLKYDLPPRYLLLHGAKAINEGSFRWGQTRNDIVAFIPFYSRLFSARLEQVNIVEGKVGEI